MIETDQRLLLELISEAQAELENLPVGGIGLAGATQQEIDQANQTGRPIEDDATYHQGQTAWRLLERAKQLLLQ